MSDGSPTPTPIPYPVVPSSGASGGRVLRRRRWLYRLTTGALTAIVALAVVDATGAVDVYGVDSAWTQSEGGGYRLAVRHPTVSRPGLASPFEVEIERAGGFVGPITLAVDARYLALWDENGFYPTPSSETTMGPWIVYEFDPPVGGSWSFAYDARIEPAVQRGRDGRVAVLVDDEPVVEVRFHTRVLP